MAGGFIMSNYTKDENMTLQDLFYDNKTKFEDFELFLINDSKIFVKSIINVQKDYFVVFSEKDEYIKIPYHSILKFITSTNS